MLNNNNLDLDKIMSSMVCNYFKFKKLNKKNNFLSILPNLLKSQHLSFHKFLKSGLSNAIKKHKFVKLHKGQEFFEIYYFHQYLIFVKLNKETTQLIMQNNTYGCFVFLPVLLIYKLDNLFLAQLDWIELGFLPFLLKSGHFYVNGISRVVLNQLVKTPGIYKSFNDVDSVKGTQKLPLIQIIPDEGSWITLSFDSDKRLWITTKVLKTKISLVVFLQALGIDLSFIFNHITNSEILLSSIIPALGVIDGENLSKNDNILKKASLKSHPLTQLDARKYIYAHYLEYNDIDPLKKQRRDLSKKYKKNSNKVFAHEACLFFNEIVWNSQNKYLGFVCREQFSLKLGTRAFSTKLELTNDDFLFLTQTIINLLYGKAVFDDIDNLINKKIRSCEDFLTTELIQGFCDFHLYLQTNFNKIKKKYIKKASTKKASTKKAKINVNENEDNNHQNIFLLFWKDHKKFLSAKITLLWRNFFLSGTLSQLLDETNPLAAMTHTRRLTVLGPGGVDNQQATIAIRGIHPTSYGRICPIETPEGQNAGLVHSFTVFSQKTTQGILTTPYYRVFKGQIQKKLNPVYLSTKNEMSNDDVLISADILFSRWHRLPNLNLPVRKNFHFDYLPFTQITAQSVSVLQMISLASSFIPFLEHNDANRTLMGSNMQRQAVPILKPEVAFVKTNLESRLILDISHIIEAPISGYITKVDLNSVQLYQPKNLIYNTTILEIYFKNLKKNYLKYIIVFHYNFFSFYYGDKFYFLKLKKSQKLLKINLSKYLLKPSNFSTFFNSKDFRILNKKASLSKFFKNSSTKKNFKKPTIINSTLYKQKSQSTCFTQKPIISENQWIEKSGVLFDGGASCKGHFAIGRNLLVAYLPWEGYNFEDAVLISEKLVHNDLFTSQHIDDYIVEVEATLKGVEVITNEIPIDLDTDLEKILKLDARGIIKKGTWVKEGDYLVGKKNMNSIETEYDKIRNKLLKRKKSVGKNTSFAVPKGVEGLVIDVEVIAPKNERLLYLAPPNTILCVKISILQRRKIQIGDKIAGRHGNKGVISKILPIEDMPYLPDGTPIDIILNPLGIPSRMNVGQIMECLLGLAGKYLNESYVVNLFDEKFGMQSSRSYVYSKLYQASIKTKNYWLFEPQHPGKIKIFDGRTGNAFQQPVTVGYTYILKLLHMVDDKLHARATGPYSAITQQPVRGRANNGGQRLGEMEVWALQAYGAAFTLQELLTIKSDDLIGRFDVALAISTNKPIEINPPESLKLLLREIQALCVNLEMYNLSLSNKEQNVISLMDVRNLDKKFIL